LIDVWFFGRMAQLWELLKKPSGGRA